MLYIEASKDNDNIIKERRIEHFNIINYFSMFFYPLVILILIGGVPGLLKEWNDNNIIVILIFFIVCFLSLLSLLVNYYFFQYNLYILYVNWYWHFVDIICILLFIIYCMIFKY